eukprot:TRINITY_DN1213_c4_g1_i1.p1 TRINITY_DN1213_c4_g1~~TRINITY_DN1213_c4_g1_i1.p1  ORF type:complete len:700 (+),score=196.40 TRINITY_DN1213_c4_g1_i1:161-2101(+)
MGQVVHASDMGNCKKALKLHKRALEDIKLLDDGECPKLKAATLHLVALMHEGMSNDEEALKCYKEAAELAQEADPKSLETARIMTDYALLESDNKQYEEALKLFESSLEIQEQFAEDSQAFAETLTSIALTHKRLKQPEKELTAYLKALSKLQAREDAKPELLTCVLNNIAMLFLEKEDYSNCVKNLERAEAVSESLTAADHPDIKCAVAYNRGLYHLDKEEWKEALPHFQESLQIEKTHFDNSLRQGTSLMKLGVVYQNLGGDENIDTAMGYFIDAFEIFDWEEEGSLLCADALSHIGFIAVDHHKALQNLFNALEIQVNKGANKIVQATTHHRIAQVYEDSRRMQAAMQHYSQAHQLLHEAEPDTLRISKLCISMVKLLRSSGGHQVAIQPMSKAMMLQQKLIPQTVEFSESYVLMGDLLIDNEKYEPAMNHLGTAAMMQEKLSPGSNLLASTYIKIGELMSYLNKHNPAAQWFQKALTIQEKNQEKDRKRLDTLKDKDEKDKTEEELDEEDKLMSEVDDARLAIIDTNLKMAENFSEDGATPLALKFYNTGLAMQENLLGRSPDMAETYYSIAKVYQKGNEREKALENYTKALELFRECDETFLLENMLIKDLMDFHKSDGQHTEARKVKAILDGLLEKYRHN